MTDDAQVDLIGVTCDHPKRNHYRRTPVPEDEALRRGCEVRVLDGVCGRPVRVLKRYREVQADRRTTVEISSLAPDAVRAAVGLDVMDAEQWARRVLDTQERAVRERLVELGWTPPDGLAHLAAIAAYCEELSGVIAVQGTWPRDGDVRRLEEAAQALGSAGPADTAAAALVTEVLHELQRARSKFPGDNVTTLALVEEVGELAKATFEESRDRVRQEAVQVATMAMRVALDGDHTLDAWRDAHGLDPLVPGRPKGTAWQVLEPGSSLKTCPRCAATALEGQEQCTNCGETPTDDMSWRRAGNLPRPQPPTDKEQDDD